MNRLDVEWIEVMRPGGATYIESHLAYPVGHTWLIQSVRLLLSVSASAASCVQSGGAEQHLSFSAIRWTEKNKHVKNLYL